MSESQIELILEDNDTPEEAEAARRQREQFDRNREWMQVHIQEISEYYRGKCICIAGQQLFAADEVVDAISQATAVHPDDVGRFTLYVPKEKAARIYAFLR